MTDRLVIPIRNQPRRTLRTGSLVKMAAIPATPMLTPRSPYRIDSQPVMPATPSTPRTRLVTATYAPNTMHAICATRTYHGVAFDCTPKKVLVRWRADDLDVVPGRKFASHAERRLLGLVGSETLGQLAKVPLKTRGRQKDQAGGAFVAGVPEGVRLPGRHQDVRARLQLEGLSSHQKREGPAQAIETLDSAAMQMHRRRRGSRRRRPLDERVRIGGLAGHEADGGAGQPH